MHAPPYREFVAPDTAQVVLIDVADEAFLQDFRWFINPDGYVVLNGHRQASRVLARAILGLKRHDGLIADHISRDKLDNRRSNLRALTPAQSAQNVGANSNASSRYRGVSLDRRRSQWVAKVRWDGHTRYIGRYRDELAAARAAEACRRVHFPFATPEPFENVGPCLCLDCRSAGAST